MQNKLDEELLGQRVKHFFTTFSPRKAILATLLLNAVVFSNSLFNKFLGDDLPQIVNNGAISSISNIPSFFIKAGSFDLYYRPVMFSTFSLIYKFFGANPFPFHLFQVILYTANAILVFFLLRKFIDQKIAFVLSLIFLVHPMNGQAAVSISLLQEPLFFLFGISALFLIMSKKLNVWSFAAMNLLLLFSLLSKETGAAWILILLFYVYLFRKNYLPHILTVSVLVIAEYCVMRFALAKVLFVKPEVVAMGNLSLLQRLASLPKILAYYLQTFLFPKDLATWQVWVVRHITITDFFLPLLLVVLFVIVLFLTGKKIYQKNKELLLVFIFFAFWFFVGLGPHLQIFPIENTVAEHWFYLSSVGFLGMIGASVQTFAINKNLKRFLIVLSVIIIGLLSARTIIRNFDFKDAITLYTHDSKLTQSNLLESNLGLNFAEVGNYQEASVHMQKAADIAPYVWSYWYNLGQYYFMSGDLTKSKESFQKAFDLTSNVTWPAEDFAVLFLRQNQNELTVSFATLAIEKYPNDFQLWLLRAIAEYRLGNKDAALSDIDKADQISPSNLSKNIRNQIIQNQPIDGI